MIWPFEKDHSRVNNIRALKRTVNQNNDITPRVVKGEIIPTCIISYLHCQSQRELYKRLYDMGSSKCLKNKIKLAYWQQAFLWTHIKGVRCSSNGMVNREMAKPYVMFGNHVGSQLVLMWWYLVLHVASLRGI